MSAQQRLTVDVGQLTDADLQGLASALARVAGWRILTGEVVMVLAQLSAQATAARGARIRGGAQPPVGDDGG